MRTFNYEEIAKTLISNEITNLISAIHEYKGKQEIISFTDKELLSVMLENAKIQSTDASNRIEEIFTSEKRLRDIVEEKMEPETRSEKEIAGYRDVLSTIHESYKYLTPNGNIILQLHRDLCSYIATSNGGRFKISDNTIEEQDAEGNKSIRFTPMSALETPEGIDRICNELNSVIHKETVNMLLLIPIFILDFLCIHPFSDGNGRVSRLLTLLLMYRADYTVGQYISIERIIEETKESYYSKLKQSSKDWHEGKNDYRPFVDYYLRITLKAYREFYDKAEHLKMDKKDTKNERVRNAIEKHLGEISKKEILEKCPDISESTVERTLAELLKVGEIKKIGGGRYTRYIKKNI